MKKIKTLFSKKVLYIVIGLVMMVLLIVGAIKLVIKNNKTYIIDNIDYGWNVAYGSSKINNISLVDYKFSGLEKGDTIVAIKHLKGSKKNIQYPILDIKTENCLMDIFIDGKKIIGNYSTKDDKYVSIKRDYTVEVPTDYNNLELKIKFSVQQNDASSILKNITIMSENDYINHQIRSNLVNYIVSSVIIILGIILAISVVCIRKKDNRIRRLFWIGLSFLFAGLAIYAKYNILELFINNSKVIENVEFIGLYMCMPCIVMLAYETFKSKETKKFLLIYDSVLVMMFLLMVVLNNIGAISYRDTMAAITIVMYITGILLLVLSINLYKKFEKNEQQFIVGTSVFYCLCMMTILISKVISVRLWDKYGQYFIMALIFEFFLVMVIYYAYVVKEYISNITEQRILSTLAYTDPLTGIMNRTKYEEVVNELENKENNEVIIVSFDLNNLKKINDTNGHEAGDVYIKTFTKVLKDVFEKLGFVGRIGGDEFIAIIENKSIEIKSIIDSMQNKFAKKMEDNKCDFEASFAYGVANSRSDDVKNIEDLIKLADKRMYEYKKEQKLGRD